MARSQSQNGSLSSSCAVFRPEEEFSGNSDIRQGWPMRRNAAAAEGAMRMRGRPERRVQHLQTNGSEAKASGDLAVSQSAFTPQQEMKTTRCLHTTTRDEDNNTTATRDEDNLSHPPHLSHPVSPVSPSLSFSHLSTCVRGWEGGGSARWHSANVEGHSPPRVKFA